MFQQYGNVEYSEEMFESGPGEAAGILTKGSEREDAPLPLEELLAQGRGDWVDIQFISTPRQILLLFNMDGGMAMGIYYDIQLERYSGLGLSG